jgi:smad nuclear-interacting protein 1
MDMLTPDLIHIYRQSCYLVGRDQVVTDIPIQHPSCSKQHAAVQFRQVTTRNEYGDSKTEIKPFVIDLDSTNGTSVNGKEIPASRYYELLQGDGGLKRCLAIR